MTKSSTRSLKGDVGDAPRLPLSRAVDMLTQLYGANGARAWLNSRLRDGRLTARCEMWLVESSCYLPDCPARAHNYDIPKGYWTIDRTSQGEHIDDKSDNRSVCRIVLNSDWSTGRFADVRTYGSQSATATQRSASFLVTGVTVDKNEFERMTRDLSLDALVPPAAAKADPVMAIAAIPRKPGRGPDERFDRVQALAALIARANDGGLGIDALLGKRGDQAIIERLLADYFAEMGMEPATSTVRSMAQIVADAIDDYRAKRAAE
jgi:hypothetical protein